MMLNPEETIVTIHGYLKKLSSLISDNSTVMVGKRNINKTRIDDLLCCIEGSLPEEFRKYVKQHGSRGRVKSQGHLEKLNLAIRNKCFWNGSVYSVNVEDALKLIKSLQSSIPSDIRFIYSSESGMF